MLSRVEDVERCRFHGGKLEVEDVEVRGAVLRIRGARGGDKIVLEVLADLNLHGFLTCFVASAPTYWPKAKASALCRLAQYQLDPFCW